MVESYINYLSTVQFGCVFDIKIGIFPFTENYATKRKCKAGPKGTIVQVNKNVDVEFYLNIFAKEGVVVDVIEEKMPSMRGKMIKIQQEDRCLSILLRTLSQTSNSPEVVMAGSLRLSRSLRSPLL